MKTCSQALLICAALASCLAVVPPFACIGQYQECPRTGECVLDPSLCGLGCKASQYLCPLSKSECVDSAEDYTKCSTLKGSWLDWTLDDDSRVQLLLKQLPVADQIMQLQNAAPAVPDAGIPAYQWLSDDEHGLRQDFGTAFPSLCALGPAFDRELMQEIGVAAATEARGAHNGLTSAGLRGISPRINGIGITPYSPMQNQAWNPFWGRNQESASEDPTLNGEIYTAYVAGWQHPYESQLPSTHRREYAATLACAKHYAVNNVESVPDSRTNFTAILEARTTWEYHLPHFQQVITEGKVGALMASYNSITDTDPKGVAVPTAASEGLMNGLVRGLWNSSLWVVSDYDAWKNVYATHSYCPDGPPSLECAGYAALNAGMDQEGGGDSAISTLQQALDDKKTTLAKVQTAFQRLFKARLQLGMHDPPAANLANYVKNDTSVLQSSEHLNLAQRGASEGLILLQNNGSVLPLDASQFGPSTGKKLAVVGFSALDGDILTGNYAVPPRDPPGIPSIAQAFESALGSSYVLAAAGCDDVSCNSTAKFPDAIKAVQDADAVIIGLGLTYESTVIPNDPRVEREGHDRTDLSLYPGQVSLLQQVRANAKPGAPVIVVLVHGGPLLLQPAMAAADAILDSHYPGIRGAPAIVDTVFGVTAPAGRVSATIYAANDAVTTPQTSDLSYNFYEAGSKGATYRYVKNAGPGEGAVLFPFGFGLSYASFQYSGLVVHTSSKAAASASASASGVQPCDDVAIEVTVTNTGNVDSDEVVQLYLTAYGSDSVPRPQVRLADFRRVRVPAGGSQQVWLFVSAKDRYQVEDGATSIFKPTIMAHPGTVKLYVGGGQPGWYTGGVSGSFDVAGDATAMSQCSPYYPKPPSA